MIDLLFTFCRVKKKIGFFNVITQPFLNLDLPQNDVHRNNFKTEKNHNKFSSQNIMTSSQKTYQNNVQEDMEKFFDLNVFQAEKFL